MDYLYAAVIFVFWGHPTAAVVIVIVVLLLVALGLIEEGCLQMRDR